jgi:hypothetical protein
MGDLPIPQTYQMIAVTTPISTDVSSTFIIAVTIIVAQVLQYLNSNRQSKKSDNKLNDIHQLVNSRYTEALEKYSDALNTISEIAQRLAIATKTPEDISASEKASAKVEANRPKDIRHRLP